MDRATLDQHASICHLRAPVPIFQRAHFGSTLSTVSNRHPYLVVVARSATRLWLASVPQKSPSLGGWRRIDTGGFDALLYRDHLHPRLCTVLLRVRPRQDAALTHRGADAVVLCARHRRDDFGISGCPLWPTTRGAVGIAPQLPSSFTVAIGVVSDNWLESPRAVSETLRQTRTSGRH